MVARDGVEPPPPAFSVRLVFQQLNFAEWPQFCDHSVTSADVRLSVGLEAKHLVFETVLRTACFDRDAPKGAINAVAFTAEGKLARKAGGYEHKKLKPRYPASEFTGWSSSSCPPFVRLNDSQISPTRHICNL